MLRSGICALGTLGLFFCGAAPAYALTADDVLSRMAEKERSGYLAGAIEMAIFVEQSQTGNADRARCIAAWYFGKQAKGPNEVIATFARYRDKPAAGLLDVLLARACPRTR